MKIHLVFIFIFACSACENKREKNRSDEKYSQNDEFKSVETNSAFEILFAEDKIILPEQTLTERVKLINARFSQIFAKSGISVIINKGLDPNEIVCHAVTIERPSLGQVIKHTCSNLRICARETNSTVEIYRCGSK